MVTRETLRARLKLIDGTASTVAPAPAVTRTPTQLRQHQLLTEGKKRHDSKLQESKKVYKTTAADVAKAFSGLGESVTPEQAEAVLVKLAVKEGIDVQKAELVEDFFWGLVNPNCGYAIREDGSYHLVEMKVKSAEDGKVQAAANAKSTGDTWYVNSASDGWRVERNRVRDTSFGNKTYYEVSPDGTVTDLEKAETHVTLKPEDDPINAPKSESTEPIPKGQWMRESLKRFNTITEAEKAPVKKMEEPEVPTRDKEIAEWVANLQDKLVKLLDGIQNPCVDSLVRDFVAKLCERLEKVKELDKESLVKVLDEMEEYKEELVKNSVGKELPMDLFCDYVCRICRTVVEQAGALTESITDEQLQAIIEATQGGTIADLPTVDKVLRTLGLDISEIPSNVAAEVGQVLTGLKDKLMNLVKGSPEARASKDRLAQLKADQEKRLAAQKRPKPAAESVLRAALTDLAKRVVETAQGLPKALEKGKVALKVLEGKLPNDMVVYGRVKELCDSLEIKNLTPASLKAAFAKIRGVTEMAAIPSEKLIGKWIDGSKEGQAAFSQQAYSHRMSVKDDTLYSYDTPLAMIDREAKQIVLNSHKYSVTTSSQQKAVRSIAADHGFTVVEDPNLAGGGSFMGGPLVLNQNM